MDFTCPPVIAVMSCTPAGLSRIPSASTLTGTWISTLAATPAARTKPTTSSRSHAPGRTMLAAMLSWSGDAIRSSAAERNSGAAEGGA